MSEEPSRRIARAFRELKDFEKVDQCFSAIIEIGRILDEMETRSGGITSVIRDLVKKGEAGR